MSGGSLPRRSAFDRFAPEKSASTAQARQLAGVIIAASGPGQHRRDPHRCRWEPDGLRRSQPAVVHPAECASIASIMAHFLFVAGCCRPGEQVNRWIEVYQGQDAADCSARTATRDAASETPDPGVMWSGSGCPLTVSAPWPAAA